MALIDEETRVMILKKTWCHGQLVLPVLSVWYLWLLASSASSSMMDKVVLLYAGIALPCWSYLSYRAVASSGPTPATFGWGALVQLAHAGILWRAARDTLSSNTTTNTILAIVSALLLIETAAFLLVLYKFGRTTTTRPPSREDEVYQHQIT